MAMRTALIDASGMPLSRLSRLIFHYFLETLHTVWQTPIVPFNTDDSIVPTSAMSTLRSVSNPFPMAAHSATAALQKQSAQRSQHPQLTTQTGPAQALRAPAVFRIPMAPFPHPASTVPPPPTKQLGSLSLRDGNDAAVSDPFATSGRAFPQTSGSLSSDEHAGRGVIGMGFGQGFGQDSIGSGLLEGGAPLTKRATAKAVSRPSMPTYLGELIRSSTAAESDLKARSIHRYRSWTTGETISVDADHNRECDYQQSHSTATLRIGHPRTAWLRCASIIIARGKTTPTTDSGVSLSYETPPSQELDRGRTESSCGPFEGQGNE